MLNTDVSLQIAKFKDIHRSRPGFILGTGPSINQQDISPLRHHITFGVNGIARMCEAWGFETTYFALTDPTVAAHNPDFLERPRGAIKFALADLDCARYNALPLRFLGMMGFSPDPGQGVYVGGTVVFTAIQLAFHMGCDPVYMLGCDLDYSGAQARCYTEDDPFSRPGVDLRYRGDTPELTRMAESFALARRVFERNNRRLYNASAGGCLEALPRVRYEEALATAPQPPPTQPNGPRPGYLPPAPGTDDLQEQMREVERWAPDADGDDLNAWASLQLPRVCFELGDRASGWTYLGELIQGRGDLECAQQYFRSALEANPTQPMVAYQLGMIARGRGDEKTARRWFRREMKRFDGDERCTDAEGVQRGMTYHALGNLNAAIRDFEMAAEEQPFSRSVRLLLGESLAEAKRYGEAVGQLTRVVDHDPSDGYAWLRLGQACRKDGDVQRALQIFEKVAMVDPPMAWSSYEYGITLMAEQRCEDAERAFSREIQFFPADGAFLQRALARARLSRADAAREDLDCAIAINPAHADEWRALIDGEITGADAEPSLIESDLE